MIENKIHPKDREMAPLEAELSSLLKPFDYFYKSQASAGLLLLLAAVLAMIISNSPWQSFYATLNHIPFSIGLGDAELSHSLRHWVNDGLMVFFFFLIGLEVKREFLVGDLSDIKHSLLVVFMAVGGMLVPAAIYALWTADSPDLLRGWGIPMATDTAFALGILALLGSKAPRAAALVLSALAIIDDIGAVLVIGLFYTESLSVVNVVWAGLVLALLFVLNITGVRKPWPYLIAGVLLWWFVLQSGIHATTAGIMTALAVPTRPYVSTNGFAKGIKKIVKQFERIDEKDKTILEQEKQHQLVEKAEDIAVKSTTPLQRWTYNMEKPVNFLILPLFAFLNAGVLLPSNPESLFSSSVLQGTVLGLLLGKVIGITFFAWIGLKLKLAQLPSDLQFIHIVGLSALAAIGFTMSIFVATLAFEGLPQLLIEAKSGILAASVIAGTVGAMIFIYANREKRSLRQTSIKKQI